MTTKTNIFMKRVIPFALVLLMVLSVALVPASANAASKPDCTAVLNLKKGQSWDLVLYNLADNAKVTYKSSKTSIATVSKKGKIKAKKKGSATITTTVKQGGKTYKLKTKVTVKTKTTVYDNIYSSNFDFSTNYNACVTIAAANGWDQDGETIEWLNGCYEVAALVQEIAKDKNAYDTATMNEVYKIMVAFLEDAQTNILIWSQPYEG